MKSNAFVFFVLGAFLFSGCSENDSTQPSPQNLKKTPENSLDPKGLLLSQIVFTNDIEGAIKGWETLTPKKEAMELLGIQHEVSSRTISNEYDANEIAADEKFKNKITLVTGRVNSISKDAFDNPFLSLQGKNSIQGVNARFKKEDIKELSTYKKGQSTNIVCRISGFSIGDVIADNCKTVRQYVSSNKIRINNYVSDVLSGKILVGEKPAHAFALYYMIDIPETSECYTDIEHKSCEDDMNKAISSLSEESKAKGSALLEKITRK
jgi:hypothetical protein